MASCFASMATESQLIRQVRLLRLYAAFTYPFACVPFLWFWFADQGVTMPQYGALISAYYVTMVVAEVPTGVMADRLGRRFTMALGPVILAAGFWTIVGGGSYPWFFAGEILLGLGHSVLSGPPSALMFETVQARGEAHDYQRQESRAHALRLAGTGLSFLIGGWIVAEHGTEPAIVLTGALCLVATIAALFLREMRDEAQHAAPGSFLKNLTHDLTRRPVAWMTAWFVVLFALLRFPFHTYQPFLREASAEDPLYIGLLFFALNVVAAPCSRALPWISRTLGETAMLWLLPGVMAVSLIAMAGQLNSFGIAMFFLHQIPFGLHWGFVQTFVNHRIGDASRATVLSALSFVGRLVFALSFPFVLGLPLADGYVAVGLFGLAGTIALMALRRGAWKG